MADPILLQAQQPQLDPRQTTDQVESAIDNALNLAAADGGIGDSAVNAVDKALGLQQPAPQTVKPQTPLQGSVQFWDYAKAKYTLTDESIKRGWLGTQVQAKGGEGWEQAVNPTPLEEDALAAVADYRKQNDLDNHMILNFLTEAGAGIPGAVPYMVEVMKGGAAGGGAGLAIGGGATAATGGAAAPLVLPLVGLGARLGIASTMAQIAQGNMYLDMRKKGIAHDKADLMAVTGGALQGAIQTAQVGTGAKATGEAAKIALGSWGKMATQFLTHQLKALPEIGIVAAQQAAAETVNHISQGIAAILDSNPGKSPLSLQSAVKTYTQTFVNSLPAFTGIIAGGKTLGFTGGATGRLMALQARRTTREVKANIQALQSKVSELETQFQAEERARQQEQDLIDEINAAIKIPSGEPEIKTEVTGKVINLTAKQGSRVEKFEQDITELNKRLDGLKGQETEEAKTERKAIREKLKEKRYQKADAELDELMAQEPSADERLMIGQRQQRLTADFRHEVLKARIAELREDAESLTAQEGELEEAISEGQSTKKPMLREQGRLDKVRDQIEENNHALQGFVSLQDFLDRNGSIQAGGLDVLDKMIVDLRSSNIKPLIQQAASEFANIAKQATKLATQETRMVQKVLADLVKASGIKNSDKFAAKIRKFKSLADLQQNLPMLELEIAKEVEAHKYKAALQAVKDAVDFEPIKEGSSRFGKHISEEYERPTVEAFNTYKSFIKDELQSEKKRAGLARNAVAAYQEALAKSEDVLPLEMGARIGAQVSGLKEKTHFELHALAQHIEELKQKGLDAATEERIRQKAVIEAVREIALKDLQGGKKIETDITQADPATLNRMYEDIRGGHLPSAFAGSIFSWGGLMRWASIHSKDPSKFLALTDVHKPTQKVATAVREAQQAYNDLLAKHSPDGTCGGAVSLILKGTKVERIGEYTRHPDWLELQPEGTDAQADLNLSPNQAVKLWLQLHDRKADTSRRLGNGYTLKDEVEPGQSTEELLDDYFSRPDRQAYLAQANALRDFYDQNFKRLADAIWDEYGVRIEQNKGYSGFLAHDGDKWDSDEDFASNWNKHLTLAMQPARAAMTIERQTTSRAMAVRDAFTEVYQQIALFEHWNVWRKAHVALSAIFANQPIRNVIKQKFGPSFMRAIDTFRRDLIWGPQLRSEGWTAAMSLWLKQYADVVLLARPGQFFKQVGGFTNALQKMSGEEFAAYFQDFMEDPAKNWARMSSREFFKNRFSNVMNQHMGALINQGFEDAKLATLKEYAAIPVKYGDKVSSVILGHIIYKNALDKGKTESQAFTEAEKFINETQSSGTLDQLSNMARNPALKVFTLLSQQPTRRLEEIVLDTLRAINHPSKETITQAKRTAVGASVAAMTFSGAGLLMTMLNPLSSDNQKKGAWENLIASAFDPVFAAGGGIGLLTRNTLAYAVNEATDLNLNVQDAQSPPEKMWKETSELLGDSIGFIKDPSLKQFAKVTRDYLFGPNILLPGKPVLPVPKQLQGVLGEKAPVTGLPLLELQNLLEGAARKSEGQ